MSSPSFITSASASPVSLSGGSWKIEGALVINSVAEWHHRLSGSLAASPTLTLDLGAVTAVDSFGLQLLWAARRSAIEGGGTFTLTTVPAVFDEACASAGLARSEF